MYDYFEIFLERMMLCRKSAEVLKTTFKLTVNGRKCYRDKLIVKVFGNFSDELYINKCCLYERGVKFSYKQT